jgi:phage-related protein
LRNVDILMGVTADESLYFAEEHIFHHYVPRKYRTNPSTTQRSLTTKNKQLTSIEQPLGFSYFKKNKYIKKYLQTNYPHLLCFYDEIQARYMPSTIQQDNITEIAHLYTNLVR